MPPRGSTEATCRGQRPCSRSASSHLQKPGPVNGETKPETVQVAFSGAQHRVPSEWHTVDAPETARTSSMNSRARGLSRHSHCIRPPVSASPSSPIQNRDCLYPELMARRHQHLLLQMDTQSPKCLPGAHKMGFHWALALQSLHSVQEARLQTTGLLAFPQTRGWESWRASNCQK